MTIEFKKAKSLALVLGLLCAPSSLVFATGLSKSVNIGPKAMGMGGAFVGIADDATAVYHNPAGITQMEGNNFYLGADSLFTDLDYTPPGGSKESVENEFIPVPSFSFVSDIAKPVYLGVGIFFPHGNGGKYDDSSAFPTNPNEGRIFSMEIIPTIAYKSDFGLSIGAGFRFVRISNGLKGQLLDIGGGNFETVEDLDVNGWGYGVSLGVFYKPIKYFSVGASLRSIVNKKLEGSVETTAGGPINGATGSTENDVTFDQTLPMVVNAGVGIYPTDKLTFGLAYQFEKNDQIDAFDVSIDNGSNPSIDLTLPQNWRDSHTIHVGADYKATDKLSVRAGYAKDFQESIPDTAINRVVGDIASHEVSAGAAYQFNKLNVGLTWNARFGERDVDASMAPFHPGPGNYKAFVNSISLGLGYKL